MSETKKVAYSIHGRDKSGKQNPTVYNPNPQEPQEPSTKRGIRRRENKKNKS